MKIYNSPISYSYNLSIIKFILQVAKEEYCIPEDFYDECDDIPDFDDILDEIKDDLKNIWSKDITPPFTDQDSGNITIIDRNNRVKYEASIELNDTIHKTTIAVTVSSLLPILVNNYTEIMLQTRYNLDGIYRRKKYDCKSKFDT